MIMFLFKKITLNLSIVKLSFIILFVTTSIISYSQNIFSPDWNHEMHSNWGIFCNDLNADKMQNAYFLIESYDDSIYIDGSGFSNAGSGGFIFKFDKYGILSWSDYISTQDHYLHLRRSVIDDSGNIYITGYSNGNVSINNSLVYTNHDEAANTFIMKFNPEGELIKYMFYGDSAYIMQLEINNFDLIATVQYTGVSNKFYGQNVYGNYSIVKISDSLTVVWKKDQQLDFADAYGTNYFESKVNDLATGNDYLVVSYVYDDTLSLNGIEYIPYHYTTVNIDSFEIYEDSFEVHIDTVEYWMEASVLGLYDYDGNHLSNISINAQADVFLNQIVIDTISDRICADLIIYNSDTVYVDSVMLIEPLLSIMDYNTLMLSLDTSGNIHNWITETDSIEFYYEPQIRNGILYISGSIETDDNDIYRAAVTASYDEDLMITNKAVTQCFAEYPNYNYGAMIKLSIGDSAIWYFGTGNECTVIDDFTLQEKYDYFLMKTPLNFSKQYINPDTNYYFPTEYYVYPNPAHNDLYISLNKFDTFGSTISITDMLGITEYPEPEKTYENIYKIDISQLNHGIYVLGMQINNRFVYYKFTKL